MTDRRYTVVRNDEEQYALWDAGRPAPQGWHAAGFCGSRSECVEHVDRVWTDQRPRSVRGVLDTGARPDHEGRPA